MERLWLKIGETAARLGVKPKELRYWEAVIPEIQPRRSKGNLRYYHVDELDRLARIRDWLREGLTVADCRELLLTGQLTRGLNLGLGLDPVPALPSPQGAPRARTLRPHRPEVAQVAAALRTLLGRLSQPVRQPPP
jgi:DNA-binding transcriptional MerR regulator